jgi:DNA-binding response OmpR family regulator
MARSVLIIDDDDVLRGVIGRVLRAQGFEVREACGAEEALHSLEDGRPDVLLTDIMMPHGDGVELITTARRRWPGVAIVAMSGRSMGALDLLQAAERLGADASLPKPFSSDELLVILDGLLARPA